MADNPNIYTQRVKLMRKLLPALAGLGLVLLLIGANLDAFSSLTGSTVRAVAPNLAIQAPQFEGRLSDGRGFRLVAQSGRQNDDGALQLSGLQLRIAATGDAADTQMPIMPDAISAQAEAGQFAADRKTAQLTGNVRVRDAAQNDMQTETLLINLDSGALRAPQTIVFSSRSGRLQASRFEGDSQTATYRFYDVDMTLQRSRP